MFIITFAAFWPNKVEYILVNQLLVHIVCDASVKHVSSQTSNYAKLYIFAQPDSSIDTPLWSTDYSVHEMCK